MKNILKCINKIPIMVLIITIVFSSSCPINAEVTTFTEGDYKYKIITDENGVKTADIQEYIGSNNNVVVPEILGGYKVIRITALGDGNFYKTITISKYVKEIERLNTSNESAKNTENIVVDSENKYFSSMDGVLFNKNKTKMLRYPRGKKDTSYVIPSSVTEDVGDTDLRFNTYLKKLTLSSNKKYKKIEECCFGFMNLEEAVIPGNIEIIGYRSFEYCKKLKKVKFNTGLKQIWDYAFDSCEQLQKVKLPNSLTYIGKGAFMSCKKLNSVQLGIGLKKIDSDAFAFCTKLKKCKIPDSVTVINSCAFDDNIYGEGETLGKHRVKLIKPSYLEKKWRFNKKNYRYIAIAKVLQNRKMKRYRAYNITKIKGTKKSITMTKGDTKNIDTTVYISKKKKGILQSDILKYHSSNKKIVKITSSGKIKAVNQGKVTITVTLRTTGEQYKVKVKVL